jgi:hypothetical protein
MHLPNSLAEEAADDEGGDEGQGPDQTRYHQQEHLHPVHSAARVDGGAALQINIRLIKSLGFGGKRCHLQADDVVLVIKTLEVRVLGEVEQRLRPLQVQHGLLLHHLEARAGTRLMTVKVKVKAPNLLLH